MGKVQDNYQKAKDSEFATKVKTTIEESVVTQKIVQGGKAVGGFISEKARIVGDKIDKNEKVKGAVDVTKQKAGQLSDAVGKGFKSLFKKFNKGS